MFKLHLLKHSQTLLAISTTLYNLPVNGATKNPKEKLNIIMFLVDDMGWGDTSVPFWTKRTYLNDRFHTPNMERLASQGMIFTQAYACSVSSPSRTSLMTGMNAARHRVTNWTLNKNISVDKLDEKLEFPEWNVNGLQPTDTVTRGVFATTLPQLLRNNGYYTIHCGKAHWGSNNTPGSDPLNLGFDINIAGHAAGAPGSYLGEKNFGNTSKNMITQPWGVPGLEKYYGDSIYLTEALTREAIHALDKALETKKPFYLYMAHYAVHVPLEPDSRFYQKYILKGLDEREACYASMIESMDKSLGDLMNYLEEKNLNENTVILFMSDNGGLSAHGRGGIPNTHNYPLKSGKGSIYEGGIRVPMIVKWPGKTKPFSICNEYIIIEDFYPTILEIAGIKKYETVQKLDGKSFLPMLSQPGVRSSNSDLIWHYPNNWGVSGPGIGTYSSIRSGDWKLIYWYQNQNFELYNIKEDIEEKSNLFKEKPLIAKKLAKRLGKYLKTVDAQRPILKNNSKPAPWPCDVKIKRALSESS